VVQEEAAKVWNATAEVRAFVKEPAGAWRRRIECVRPRGRRARAEIERRFPQQDRLLRHATLEDVFLLRTGRTLRE
jgi:hypothetical protein